MLRFSLPSTKDAANRNMRLKTDQMRSSASARVARNVSLLLLACLSVQAFAQDSATYKMTFEGLWTADDITDSRLPGSAHFTQVIGATHNSSTTLWRPGGTASQGIENVAELGSTSALRTEINSNPNAIEIIAAGSSFISPRGTVSDTFTSTTSHPLVSVLSMIAPTPDWFVGVSSLSLYDNGWRSRVQVDLYPYDAGTEDGGGWSLGNPATNPQGVITSIRNKEKFNNNPLGRLTFELQTPVFSKLSIANASVSEGNSGEADLTFTVTLDKASSSSISVDWATSSTTSDTATAGSDYTAASGTLTFSAGQTSKTFVVKVQGDVQDEVNETFTVTLSDASGDVELPSPATARGTIIDDDDPAPVLPGRPTGLSATASGRSRIDLAWKAPSSDGGASVTGYHVEASANAGANWSTLAANTESTDTSYAHLGLAHGSTRQYRVSAINSVGTGPASNEATATTDSNSAPVFASADFERSVDENTPANRDIGSPIRAQDSEGDTVTYQLQGTDAASFALVSSSGQLRTLAALNHEAKSAYQVTLLARDSFGAEASVPVRIRVSDVAEPPARPSTPFIASRTSTGLTLSWRTPAGSGPAITSYELEHRRSGSASWTRTTVGNVTTTGLFGLAPDTLYEVRLRAVNEEGAGDWSEVVSARTEQQDSDGDGVIDEVDAFPFDPAEWSDNDQDGLGDNADTDDDNDGIKDARDLFPLDASLSGDSDGDGVVDERDPFPMDGARTATTSYRLVDGTAEFGSSVSSAGDFDQDGLGDFLISGLDKTYLVSAAGLGPADTADGLTDHSIAMQQLLDAGSAWSMSGQVSLVEIGDIGGDSRPEFAFGHPGAQAVQRGSFSEHAGEAWLFTADEQSLAEVDAEDGNADGLIDSAHLSALDNSLRIVGSGDAQAGYEVQSVGDLDVDDIADLIVTTHPKGSERGAVYILSGAELWNERSRTANGEPTVALDTIAAKGTFWKVMSRHSSCRLQYVSASRDFGGGTPAVILLSQQEQAANAYVIAISDLEAADAADGDADGIVEVEHTSGLPDSWALTAGRDDLHSLRTGDVDGDGIWDLIISGRAQSDPTYVLKGSDLDAADSADGEADRSISLSSLQASGARKFEASGDLQRGAIGEMDSDALADLALLQGSGREGKLVFGKTLQDLTNASDGLPFTFSLASPYHNLAAIAFTEDLQADGGQELLIATQVDTTIRELSGADDDPRRGHLFSPPAAVYLVDSRDLHALDLADGRADKRLLLTEVSGDADEDGIANLLESDDDNDGVLDYLDSFPEDASEWEDSDGDRIGDALDDFPLDQHRQFDTDRDGLADRQDDDDDGDGIADADDMFPLDTDNDSLDNHLDEDDDNDGFLDTLDALPFDDSEHLDSDGDGTGNNADADDDNDGVPDTEDAFPHDASQSKDTDGDGVGDALDAFPTDAAESIDSDGDGVGDLADRDDDNDGVVDTEDAFPTDASEVGDADADGLADSMDVFPQDPLRTHAESYEFTSSHWRLNTGLSSAGDIDDDGRADILVGVAGTTDAAYIVASSDLTAADAADGTLDRQIDLDLASREANSWKLTATEGATDAGFVMHALDDYDSNGIADFLVAGHGSVYVISAVDLASADLADGTLDGTLMLDNIAAEPNSWRITSDSENEQVGTKAAPVGDINADGIMDILFNSVSSRADTESPLTLYLLSLASLSAVDDADGDVDGALGLTRIAADPSSWKLEGAVAAPNDALRSVGGDSAAGSANRPGFSVICAQCAPGAEDGERVGAAYWVAASSLRSADRADGAIDGTVELERLPSEPDSWKFLGAPDDDLTMGIALPDLDGDSRPDLMLSTQHRSYFVSGDDLVALDGEDGVADGSVRLIDARARRSWRTEYSESWSEWWQRFAVGDMASLEEAEGQARSAVASRYNLLHAAPTLDVEAGEVLFDTGAVVYGVPRATLEALDASQDVRFANLVSADEGWRLVPRAERIPYEQIAAVAGDVNLDDRPELLVGNGDSVLLLNRADFSALDAVDGLADRIISLAYVAGDTDGDGYEDLIDKFPHDRNEWADRDGDGISDGEDAFPFDASEALDSDSDGVGDNADAFPQDASETLDSDADGIGDNADAFPKDASETLDSDGDGVGDNADSDDDNDGVPDEDDAFPFDSAESKDSDDDGVGDNADAFPQDASETLDSDGDGVGDNADSDDDNDGVPDEDDADPLDPEVKGNPRLLQVEFYQGPLARVWGGDREASHLPLILGRQAVLALDIGHHGQQAPEIAVSAGPQGDDDAKELLPSITHTSAGSRARPEPRLRETSYLFELKGSLMQDAHEVLVSLDPDNVIDEDDESDNLTRIPLHGEALPRFEISFVPIRTSEGAPEDIVAEDYMQNVYDFLPIADDYQAQVASPHDFQGSRWRLRDVALELLHRWNNEAPEGQFWHGIFNYPHDGTSCGYGFYGIGVGVSAALDPSNGCGGNTIQAHEIGHNFNLRHVAAGCGEGSSVDHDYPYPLGGMGPHKGWFFSEETFIGPDDGYYDFMSYCEPVFVSDYHFRKSIEFRLQSASEPSANAASPPRLIKLRSPDTSRASSTPAYKSIAITGAIDAYGTWSLYRASLSTLVAKRALAEARHTLLLTDSRGLVVHEQPLTVHAAGESGEAAFAARLPFVANAERLQIQDEQGLVLLDTELDFGG